MPAAARKALRACGLDADELIASSRELILCGSRVTPKHGARSDWDLIAIGSAAPRRKRGLIDLIPIAAGRLSSPAWLESELASHAVAYGIWLVGDPGPWTAKVRITRRTLRAKLRRIEYRLDRMEQAWHLLSVQARARYYLQLRRDLQRLQMLRMGTPVPPAPALDLAWRRAVGRKQAVASLVADLPRTIAPRVRKWLAAT